MQYSRTLKRIACQLDKLSPLTVAAAVVIILVPCSIELNLLTLDI